MARRGGRAAAALENGGVEHRTRGHGVRPRMPSTLGAVRAAAGASKNGIADTPAISGDDRAGEDLDGVVQLIHGRVVEAARGGDLGFDLGPGLLRFHHRAIGFELRVGFHADEQLPDPLSQLAFEREALAHLGRRRRRRLARFFAQSRDVGEQGPLVLHEAARERDDVRDEVVALIEVDVNRAQGFLHLVPPRDDGGVPEVKDDQDRGGDD